MKVGNSPVSKNKDKSNRDLLPERHLQAPDDWHRQHEYGKVPGGIDKCRREEPTHSIETIPRHERVDGLPDGHAVEPRDNSRADEPSRHGEAEDPEDLPEGGRLPEDAGVQEERAQLDEPDDYGVYQRRGVGHVVTRQHIVHRDGLDVLAQPEPDPGDSEGEEGMREDDRGQDEPVVPPEGQLSRHGPRPEPQHHRDGRDGYPDDRHGYDARAAVAMTDSGWAFKAHCGLLLACW